MKFKATLIAAASLAFAAGAFAQAAPAAKPARMVSKDELRVCMNNEVAIAATRKDLEAKRNANQAEQAAIRAEAQTMAEDQKNLDESNDRRVREFKRRVDTHNERVKASNAALAAYRTDVEGLNKMAIAYNEQCAGISFLSEDKEAILKEREAAQKK